MGTINGPALDFEMVQAWLDAAKELGVRVIAPHSVQLADGRAVLIEAFLPDFGSRSGALAISFENSTPKERELPVWSSRLYESYRVFDRQFFIDTLDDWGWFGASEPPAWFSGKLWTSQLQ